MKKNRRTVFCIIVCVAMLTACGGEYASLTEGDVVSGSAVSGSTVSGGAVSEGAVNDKVAEPDAVSGSAVENEKEARRDMSSYRFCTDTNMYYVDDGQIIQARLDGTHQVVCKEKDYTLVSLCYVAVDYLYYEFSVKSSDWSVIYRVPIRKGADGYDVVNMSEKEEILTGTTIQVVYADANYLFYQTEEDEVIKYDLQKLTGEKTSSNISQEGWVWIIRVTDGYLAVSGGEDVFIQKKNSLQWKKISGGFDGIADWEEKMAQNKKAVFYPQYLHEHEEDLRICIIRCDGRGMTDFVTWEQLSQTAIKAKKMSKLDICQITKMFWQKGRLYIQLHVGWMENEIYHMEYMILSQKENEDGTGAGLRYEKKLTESMQSQAETRVGKWADVEMEEEDLEDGAMVEHMTYNDVQCIAMINGQVYISCYDYEEGRGRLACGKLNDSKFQWVNKEDPLFYELGYDGILQEFRVVFNERYAEEEEDENKYTGFVWDPSVDKCGAGWFWED